MVMVICGRHILFCGNRANQLYNCRKGHGVNFIKRENVHSTGEEVSRPEAKMTVWSILK